MAKRGTPEHPKTLKLSCKLDICPPFALGILEALWHWSARYAIDGELTKYEPNEIAIGIRYDGDPDLLVEALISCGLLDRVEGDRLVIHDVRDHAENCWKQNLADAGLCWWDGSNPRLAEKGRPRRTAKSDHVNSSKSPDEIQKNSKQTPQPEPEPEPKPRGRARGGRQAVQEKSRDGLQPLRIEAREMIQESLKKLGAGSPKSSGEDFDARLNGTKTSIVKA